MASVNPYDLLVDDDEGDTSVLIAAIEQKLAAAAADQKSAVAATTKPAKLPSKPLPPTQAVREARNEGGRGYGRGRGAGGVTRDRDNIAPTDTLEDTLRKPYERRNGFEDDARGRGGRRGGFNNGDVDGERPRRNYERRSGTGRGSEIKRDGAGRGNWGTTTDDIAPWPEVEEPIAENEVNVVAEKPAGEEKNVDAEKESTVKKVEEEPEEKQLTLGEYEKLLEEKRKALLSLSEQKKGEERKVDVEEFQSMQLVSKKKNDDEVFIKLGSEKDKRRDAAEKEEKAKKSVSINEFLKPVEGEAYYRSGGRGRGRGRGGDRGGQYGGGGFANAKNNMSAPAIEDQRQFPTLGAK